MCVANDRLGGVATARPGASPATVGFGSVTVRGAAGGLVGASVAATGGTGSGTVAASGAGGSADAVAGSAASACPTSTALSGCRARLSPVVGVGRE
jgi:hypothetical protein